MKQVLVIYYSQSGQLKEIADQIALPLKEHPSIQVDYYEIKPIHDFPFPWSDESFFNAFPESFRQIPIEVYPPPDEIFEKQYDLILFHYQVWYLTPSIPTNSFLKSKYAEQIMSGRPVITINGSRNMWAMAQEKVKALLKKNKATLVGNIALVDKTSNLISVITVVDWMYTGLKRKVYGILPLPGVSAEDIQNSSRFGDLIIPYLLENQYDGLQTELLANGAIKYRSFLVSVDKKANKMFQILSKIILKNPNKRKFLLRCFKVYLLSALWIISPFLYLVELVLYPFFHSKVMKEKKITESI